MRNALFFLWLLASIVAACTSNETAQKEKQSSAIDTGKHQKASNSAASNKTGDTIRKFEVDDYPVSNEMLANSTNNLAREIKSGTIRSIDKEWFTNPQLNQTLVFEIYTDLFRVASFHFLNNDIPPQLIQKMELHTEEGRLAKEDEKQKHFIGFVKVAEQIEPKYFITNKKIQLGDKMNKAIEIYGKPDRILKSKSHEMYEWSFAGELLYDGKKNAKAKPLAKDNYGHQVIMFFRNKILIGMILHNDIP